MVLGPEDGEQETKEKHHQAKANQADDCKKTKTDCCFTVHYWLEVLWYNIINNISLHNDL